MKTKLAGMGGAPAQTYVDDVFSTYLYTGTGATQTITNGIDLAGKGGMVWTKVRSISGYHVLNDTMRGVGQTIYTNLTAGQNFESGGITSFNSNGYTTGLQPYWNENAQTFVSQTFRKAAKFFDVVTYTGTGATGQLPAITHSLNSTVGMVVVKCTSHPGNWIVGHISTTGGNTQRGYLNTTDAFAYSGVNGSYPMYSQWDNKYLAMYEGISGNSTISLNELGKTYVAYLFAHDTSSTGIIQCGSFNSAGGQYTLGWEPQYFLIKRTDAAEDWQIYDVMRGWITDGSGTRLVPNSTAAELGGGIAIAPTATGFRAYSGVSKTYIYMAIRRPNKPPTTGMQVFSLIAYTLNNTANRYLSGFGFPTDLSIFGARSIAAEHATYDRLRGGSAELQTQSTAAEYSTYPISLDKQDGILLNGSNWNGVLGATAVWWNFKRAPGFFDVVCFTYSGSVQTVPHNLTVVPELMIVKNRTGAADGWNTYVSLFSNTESLDLSTTAAKRTGFGGWGSTTPTASNFYIQIGASGVTYVAYLFATLAGISKVGSYTGNGSSQNINCGFAAGARFVLIKRTDSTGDWYVWDTARGIVSANDPHLSLNTTAAEVTTDDSVDPYSAGFAVNQVAATNINVSSATYIFLAIA